jgi:hypothetical protein
MIHSCVHANLDSWLLRAVPDQRRDLLPLERPVQWGAQSPPSRLRNQCGEDLPGEVGQASVVGPVFAHLFFHTCVFCSTRKQVPGMPSEPRPSGGKLEKTQCSGVMPLPSCFLFISKIKGLLSIVRFLPVHFSAQSCPRCHLLVSL